MNHLIRLVTLNFDRDHLAQLPVNRRNLLHALEVELNDFKIAAPLVYEARLPLHQTDQRPAFRLSDLFMWASSIDEPQSLAIDEHGDKKRLSSNQFETVREKAQLSVPSRKFPDQYHVWKLNRIIQEGSLYTKIVFEETLSSSLEYVIVSIPENIFDNPDHATRFSAQKGVKTIHHGILALLSSMIGLIEERPEHEPHEVSHMVDERRIEFIKKSIAADSFLDSSVFRSCLYDKELAKTVEADLTRIRKDHRDFWISNELMSWKQSIEKFRTMYPEADRNDPSFLNDRVREDLESQKHETLNERFRSDTYLNEICPGYGILLANQLSAAKIVSDEDTKRNRLAASRLTVINEHLSLQHPILSRIQGWAAPRINRQVEEFAKEIEVAMKNDISRRLLENGLQLELYVRSESLKFEKEEGESYRSQLSSKRVPAAIFPFTYRIWQSKNWKREKMTPTTNLSKETVYVPREYEYTEIPTNRLFWRWNVALHRIKYCLNDGLYEVLVENLWNGVLGLKAMSLTSRSFYPLKTMDEGTGEISFDRNTVCSTYIGNLDATLTRYRMTRSAFESAPDEGLLGKGITRPFFVAYQVLLCTASVLVIGVGQPVLTIFNLAVSILIAVTSPLWALFFSIFMLICSFTLFDMDYPRIGRTFFYFPIPFQLIHILFMGVGQIILKVAQCVVFDFPMFLLEGTYAYVRYCLRKVWDAMLLSILHSRMKVPGVDSFWAKRIKGPGLSNSYFYQVELEVAIAALLNTLQKEELDFYVIKETAEIKRPLRDFNNFFKDLIAPLTIDASKLPETLQLQQEEKNNLDTLKSVTRTGYEKLKEGSLGAYIVLADRIKLTKENLDDTLAQSQEIVTAFYKERLSQYININTNPNESMKYWRDKALFEDDFKGLTAYYYGKTFHPAFLFALQATDDDFVIRVIQPSLDDVVTNFPRSYHQSYPPYMPPPLHNQFLV